MARSRSDGSAYESGANVPINAVIGSFIKSAYF